MFLVFGINTFLHAQKSNQVLSYSVSEEKGLYNFIYGNLYVLDANVNNYNLNLGSDLEIGGIHNRIRWKTEYDFSYFNRINNNFGNDPSNNSIYENTPSNSFKAEIGYVFKQLEYQTDHSLQIKNNDTIFFADVTSAQGKRYTIDLGFDKGVTYYTFNKNKAIQAMDVESGIVTTIASDQKPPNIITVDNIKTIVSDNVSSYLYYNYITLGVSKYVTYSLKGEFLRNGKKRSSRAYRLYSAFLINYKTAIDNIAYTNINTKTLYPIYYTFYQLQGYTKFLPVGIKAGFDRFSGNSLSVLTGVEGGMIPGPTGNIVNNLYLKLKIGISLTNIIK